MDSAPGPQGQPASTTSRRRVMRTFQRENADRAPVVCPTSVATGECMDEAQAHFPGAHREPAVMAALAATASTLMGFDTVMPVYSIVQESSALGCAIDWGDRSSWPAVQAGPPLWQRARDIRVPDDLLEHPDVRCVLDAIRLLRHRLGDDAAIVGKALGPWTLAYHVFGLEPFLIMSLEDPEETHRCLALLKEVTIAFGRAQIEAGADALTLPDHATGDLVSADYYRRYLQEIHAELVERLPAPVILHICGRTLDRMGHIAETGVAAFHFDSKNDPERAMEVVDGRMLLVGGVSTAALLSKGPREVRDQVESSLSAGVQMIAPECAISPATPGANLAEISHAVASRGTDPAA
jgi:MtaA/CmuA family methyltransferase